ncbi:PREDICTED: CTP synthase-like [Lupinus angustifolius]|uniref:CTP synthase-like n=1 Tax=Lupinus angustifolius TaxID=3871 RepID=UPI00092EB627|nr:PREDICTED: CTP synthase-like isoform X2 [Lupinus angustifolius]XP_019433886.1 PREDICTED: CTP synthase-like [Lupinus angustifolius]
MPQNYNSLDAYYSRNCNNSAITTKQMLKASDNVNIGPCILFMISQYASVGLTTFMRFQVRIVMVGKYTGLSDAYLSILKGLLHAGVAHNRKLIVEWVPAWDLEDVTSQQDPDTYKVAWELLKVADDFLVPGGFSDRGVQGKILAAKYGRENNVPFLGICLGMKLLSLSLRDLSSVCMILLAHNLILKPKTLVSYLCQKKLADKVVAAGWYVVVPD